MATYLELHALRNDQDVVNKTYVAIVDVAKDILAPESPTTQARADWAKAAIKNPLAATPELLHYVLIANAAFTQAQIRTASDASYKTAVATAVTKIVGAAI